MPLRRANNSQQHSEVSGLQPLPAQFTRSTASAQLVCVITLCVDMPCKVKINFRLREIHVEPRNTFRRGKQHAVSPTDQFSTRRPMPSGQIARNLSFQERFT